MDRIELFRTELNLIEEDDVRGFAQKALELLPNYFFTCAASSSGMYHPEYALNEGGLVRHTKAAIGFANHMFNIEQSDAEYTTREKDLVIVALMLHDGWKHGDKKPDGTYRKTTIFEHPQVASDWIRNCEELNDWLPQEDRNIMADAVASHMGQWNTQKKNAFALQKPQSKIQKVVHLCDYLASRKDIEVLFNDYTKPEVEIPKLEDYVLTFGKHSGEKLVDVAKSDSGYIAWCKENMTREPMKSLLKQL